MENSWKSPEINNYRKQSSLLHVQIFRPENIEYPTTVPVYYIILNSVLILRAYLLHL